MGRRAKNKQAAPIPLHEPRDNQPSPKKLGKRKADLEAEDDAPASRPAKKAKETAPKTKAQPSSNLKKKSAGKPKAAPTAKKDASGKILAKAAPASDEEGGSDGWEDVEDEVDMKAQTK